MIFSKRSLLICIVCLVTATSVLAQPAWAQSGNASSRNTGDYFLIEFLFGLQGALIGGGIGYYGTYLSMAALRPCPADQPIQACDIEKSFFSLVIGTNIGIPTGAALIGVHLAGTLLGIQGGNLLLALAGAWVGSLAGATLGSNWALQPSDVTLVFNPVTLAALGATIGYNVGTTIPLSLPSVEFRLVSWRF
jgi:hypothetical protein